MCLSSLSKTPSFSLHFRYYTDILDPSIPLFGVPITCSQLQFNIIEGIPEGLDSYRFKLCATLSRTEKLPRWITIVPVFPCRMYCPAVSTQQSEQLPCRACIQGIRILADNSSRHRSSGADDYDVTKKHSKTCTWKSFLMDMFECTGNSVYTESVVSGITGDKSGCRCLKQDASVSSQVFWLWNCGCLEARTTHSPSCLPDLSLLKSQSGSSHCSHMLCAIPTWPPPLSPHFCSHTHTRIHAYTHISTHIHTYIHILHT